MSTATLKSHKKVASVETNEAGKAIRLTLRPPWVYEGSHGPFDLDSVNHGHQIVKSAYHEDKGPPPKPKAPPAPAGPKLNLAQVSIPDMEMPDGPFKPLRCAAVGPMDVITFWAWTTPRGDPLAAVEKEWRTRINVDERFEDNDEVELFFRHHTRADEGRCPSPFDMEMAS